MKKALILYFSPSGNTRKVAQKFDQELKALNFECSLIDLTGNKDLWIKKDFKGFFSRLSFKHDLLLIGAPVYAHLFPKNMRDFLSQLPLPDDVFGKYAVVFNTYGGVSSGRALSDASEILHDRKRIVLAGLKVNAEHCLARKFKTRLNQGMPGREMEPFIQKLACKLAELNFSEPLQDSSESFNYQINYQFPGEPVFPPVKIDFIKCRQCGLCAKKCPVGRIGLIDGKIVFNPAADCIYCGECFYCCPHLAVIWDIQRFEGFLSRFSDKNLLLAKEISETAVYLDKRFKKEAK